jgi:hypothetical protein
MEVLTTIAPDEVDEQLRKAVGDIGCLAIRAAVEKEAADLLSRHR